MPHEHDRQGAYVPPPATGRFSRRGRHPASCILHALSVCAPPNEAYVARNRVFIGLFFSLFCNRTSLRTRKASSTCYQCVRRMLDWVHLPRKIKHRFLPSATGHPARRGRHTACAAGVRAIPGAGQLPLQGQAHARRPEAWQGRPPGATLPTAFFHLGQIVHRGAPTPGGQKRGKASARCDTLRSCQRAQEYKELKARFEQPMCSAEAGRLRCCWLLCARPGFKTF